VLPNPVVECAVVEADLQKKKKKKKKKKKA
jgi:hypothetical protein